MIHKKTPNAVVTKFVRVRFIGQIGKTSCWCVDPGAAGPEKEIDPQTWPSFELEVWTDSERPDLSGVPSQGFVDAFCFRGAWPGRAGFSGVSDRTCFALWSPGAASPQRANLQTTFLSMPAFSVSAPTPATVLTVTPGALVLAGLPNGRFGLSGNGPVKRWIRGAKSPGFDIDRLGSATVRRTNKKQVVD